MRKDDPAAMLFRSALENSEVPKIYHPDRTRRQPSEVGRPRVLPAKRHHAL
jgi:hypothetical protein